MQVNFFAFVAQEVRIGLARLGMRSLDELIGRADLLRQKDDLKLGKTSHLDMSFLTTYAGHEPGDSSQRRNAKVCLPLALLVRAMCRLLKWPSLCSQPAVCPGHLRCCDCLPKFQALADVSSSQIASRCMCRGAMCRIGFEQCTHCDATKLYLVYKSALL